MYGTFRVVRRDKEIVTEGGGGGVVTYITFNTRKQKLIAVIVSKQCPLLKSRLQVR
jgi:hypothetical protein